MINIRDVVKIKMPFPNISSALACRAHMYICCDNSDFDKVIKVQTFKPFLLTRIENYLDSDYYIGEHPFKDKSLIDLDKCFNIEKGKLTKKLKVANNNGQISERFHSDIMSNTTNLFFCNDIHINTEELVSVDDYIS
ncbi:hypothetical protein ACN9UU_08365 [Staphylococcus caprae]|uniref:hypothetical protein n=1 Tax=Staphylococcus caprae TaxID=29380 RepID=UPI00066E0036|nr:hypothetical protein [Staphylococcus caprae]MBU5272851.1 hypothetical protein [Staphylococcus caprae]QJE24317.1 hypothetical protein HHJ99_00630 [Staphylococcus caprae]